MSFRDQIKSVNFKAPFQKLSGAVDRGHLKHRILLIAVFCILTFVYVFAFMPRTAFQYIASGGERINVGEVTADRQMIQEISPGERVLKGIGIDFDTYDRTNRAEYYVNLLDGEGNVLAANVFNADKVVQGEPYYVPLPQVETHAGERYLVQLGTDQATEGNALGVFINVGGENQNAPLSAGSGVLAGSLTMQLGFETMSANIWIGAVILMAAVSLAILFWGKKLHINLLVLVLIFGVLFSLVTPVLDTPDEAEHCAKAFLMMDGGWVTPVSEGGGYLTKSFDTVNANKLATLASNTMAGVPVGVEAEQGLWGSGQFFLGYIPQTVGLWIAKLFHADLMGTFYMGRIFNLLFYAVCAFFAVKIAPKFKLFLAVLALMPMALVISGSYNSDGLVYGLSLLLGAYFIDLFFNQSYKISWKQMLIFLLLAALITMKKYWVAPLCLLPFFIPASRYRDKRTKWLGSLMILAATIVAAFAVVRLSTWMNFDPGAVGTSALDGQNERGASVGMQLSWMLGNPATAASVVSKSILRDLGDNLAQLFNLGEMTYFVESIFIFLYIAFLAVVAFSYTRYEYKPELAKNNAAVSLLARGLILFTILATVLLVYLALYLTWTPVGAQEVLGVQGRYFIPIFFLLPFLGQNTWPLVTKDAYERAQYNVTFVAVLAASVTLLTTLMRYY